MYTDYIRGGANVNYRRHLSPPDLNFSTWVKHLIVQVQK